VCSEFVVYLVHLFECLFAGYTTTEINMYDTTSLAWSDASLSRERRRFPGVSLGGTAFFVGGYDNTIEMYSILSGTTTTYGMTHSIRDAAAASVANQVIAVGGQYWVRDRQGNDIYYGSDEAYIYTAPAATTSAAPATTSSHAVSSSVAPATTSAPNPFTTAPPATSIPPPSTGSLCTSDCGTCCCPGCHAINGTCYLCPAASFSSDCLDHLQSSCRACPSGFFCPQGAVQPYLPSTTLALIVVGRLNAFILVRI
jgi:hypothetical protein